MTRIEQEHHAARGVQYHAILKELDEWLKQQYESNNKLWAGTVRGKLVDLLTEQHIDLWNEP